MRCPPLQAFWMNTPIETTLLFSDPKATLIPEDIINMFNQFKSEHQDSSFIYTDGSRADNRTGSAFLVDGYHQSSRLPDFFSVFSAELQAIASALQYTRSSPWPSGLKRWNQTLVPMVRARFEPRCGRPHFAPTRSGVCICGRNRTEAREREWAEGTVSSLPGTLNVRIKFCHSTGIARSGGGVRASTTSYA